MDNEEDDVEDEDVDSSFNQPPNKLKLTVDAAASHARASLSLSERTDVTVTVLPRWLKKIDAMCLVHSYVRL